MQRFFMSVLLAAVLALGWAVQPAQADDSTISGKVTEPNFMVKGFWIQSEGGKHIPVFCDNATFKYNGQDANIYRLMGTPTAQVTGQMNGEIMNATSVNITSGPTARLERSSYTDQAQPPFGPNELVTTSKTPAENGGITTPKAHSGGHGKNSHKAGQH